MAKSIEHSIEVEAPIRAVYNQWTQFESFPQFMEHVEKIDQIDDTTTRWQTKVAGVERDFTAKITEQEPDQRIAWKVTEGTEHAGVVTFHHIGDTTTRVTLQMDFESDGILEAAANTLGITSATAKGDLERFKEFIESQGAANGGWRGEVEQNG